MYYLFIFFMFPDWNYICLDKKNLKWEWKWLFYETIIILYDEYNKGEASGNMRIVNDGTLEQHFRIFSWADDVNQLICTNLVNMP